MVITANRDRCIGAGMCALLAPNVFDQDDDDGLVRVLHPAPTSDHSTVREAVAACPARALAIDEPRR
ncbi:ferredoxin [Nocardia crassostreae]|uniref:ferredoxin n=1 Tax=Nocardia crassostreae TaxID=53428 RepID=UPI00083089E0|nr:ferredoxin [Nocardia crassostreae]